MTDIKELEEKIKIYNKKYYDGNEQITDKEYDMLIAELRALDPENKLLDTVIDNCDNIEGFKKLELPIVMGTLKKCQNEEQILKEFKQEIGTYLLEDKIDGVSACVSFENGIFSQAISRGNAEFGFDITNNFSQIEFKNKNSQVYIDGTYLFNGYIRGEVYMKKEIFEKYFKDKMKNPRAAAAGLMKRLDASDCKYLSFIAYDVFNDYFADKTEKDKLMFLTNNGFEIPRFTVAKSPQEIIDFRNSILKMYGVKLKPKKKPIRDKDGKIILEEKPMIIGGGTYASYFDNMVGFGPKYQNIRTGGHGKNENISKEEFKKNLFIYYNAILELCK